MASLCYSRRRRRYVFLWPKVCGKQNLPTFSASFAVSECASVCVSVWLYACVCVCEVYSLFCFHLPHAKVRN